MKRILYILAVSSLGLSTTGLAEEAKCGCMKDAPAKTAQTDEIIDKLLAQMNGSVGEEKLAAMAALLNQLVQGKKAMAQKMAMCEKMMAEKGAGETAKPADPHAHH